MPSLCGIPEAGLMSSPTMAAIRIGLRGIRSAGTKWLRRSCGVLPDTAWANAIRLWVLPPPNPLSRRMMAGAVGSVPESRPNTSCSRARRPPVGNVREKNSVGSAYTAGVVGEGSSAQLRRAANSSSRSSPERTSGLRRQTSGKNRIDPPSLPAWDGTCHDAG